MVFIEYYNIHKKDVKAYDNKRIKKSNKFNSKRIRGKISYSASDSKTVGK